MTDQYAEKASRLLDIIDEIVSNDGAYPDSRLPFLVDGEGRVTFDSKLSAELAKPENSDLLDWAHEHIVHLFE